MNPAAPALRAAVRGGVVLVVAVLAVGCHGEGGTASPEGAVVMAPAPPVPPAPPWALGGPGAAAPAFSASLRPASTTSAGPSPSVTVTASPPVRATAVDPGPCLPLDGPGTPVPVTVTATRGSVVMTWWHNGDPAAVAYWVGVQPQTWATPSATGAPIVQAPAVWTRLTPPQGCRTVTFTVPGVVRGTAYTLWLDLEALTPETAAGRVRVSLNRVSGVALP